ncbi:GNAT family N-acetyltransferase [Mesorhizobium sp. IMUNJ 23232]|uniref:GNAT family N-acetyltransferase n=1 Tax=Mesorhizobium sp. IMUNJ 23232 TaxID=3376064 RepID=UPI0037AF8B52
MSAIIRPMERSDIAAAATLRHAIFFDGSERTVAEDAAGLEKLLGGDGFEAALVAEVDRKLVGNCLLVREELDLDYDQRPWLAGLLVAPQYRKRGIGSRLVAAIEGHARSVGCEALYLYTHGAEAFYTTLGWTVAERFLQHGDPAVVMSKDLRLG